MRQGLLLIPALLAAAPVAAMPRADQSAISLLLQQVQAGESVGRYDLVNQALYRLQGIDPDNPQVLAAQLRLALYQGDQGKAQQYLTRLNSLAPQALATRQAQASLLLTRAEGRQQLQQARLLATSGRVAEAVAQYDKLFNGVFPASDMALEYWRTVARLPGQEKRALAQLQALDDSAPGNVNVRLTIARMALGQDNPRAAFSQLRAVAANPAGRQAAAEMWLNSIKSQPVTAVSLNALQQYLQVFTDGTPQSDGLAERDRQQKMLADPGYQARLRGLALIEKGEGGNAIPALAAALRAAPDDPDLLGAMGQAQARANNRVAAAGYFARAIRADANGADINKWRSLQTANQYWLAIAQGDKALAQKNYAAAQQQYQAARVLDSSDGYALIGLGDVQQAQHNAAAAEQLFLAARKRDPGNATAVRRLVALYQQQSPQRAMAYISQLPAAQKRAFGELLNSLKGSAYSSEADRLMAQGNAQAAAEQYRQALTYSPDDVWLNYHYAGALRQAGQDRSADAAMTVLARRRADDVTQVYASALYLAAADRDDAALQRINALPQAQWTTDIRDLATRLQTDATLRRANALRAAGQEKQALALLHTLPATTRTELAEADWALERGDAADALQGYQRVTQREPDNADARLGQIEALVVLNRGEAARRQLQALPAAFPLTSLNTGRRVANAWLNVGDHAKAQALYQQLKPLAARAGPSQASALVLRDAARLEHQSGQPQPALGDYRQAMVASGIMPTAPVDDLTFTRLTRNNDSDDWLKRSIRSDAGDLYRQQDTILALAEDYSRNSGTGGISDFTARTTMAQAETPIADGRGFLRLDNVDVSAGTFARDANGNISENFGTCASGDAVCDRDFKQQQNGTSIGAGFRNDRWAADLGTTPLGFAVTRWVGGISWNTDLRDLGVTFTASRRPIASSLLAYAGARDPNSGKTFGGVVATGGAIGLSYDQGGANGVWGDISAHQITGENVADNSRERLMGGYYRKIINEPDRRATIGLNSMLWHYDKDLSDYSLGQGGYYSPQRYLSFSLPVSYRQRTENWSFDLGGSVSWSQSASRAEARYPLSFGSLTSDNSPGSDSHSSGVGYTLQATVERRMTSHWTLGVGVDVQQAKDYTPSHGLLYARYSMAGWEGDLDLPPQPLTPYADFK